MEKVSLFFFVGFIHLLFSLFFFFFSAYYHEKSSNKEGSALFSCSFAFSCSDAAYVRCCLLNVQLFTLQRELCVVITLFFCLCVCVFLCLFELLRTALFSCVVISLLTHAVFFSPPFHLFFSCELRDAPLIMSVRKQKENIRIYTYEKEAGYLGSER